MKKTSKEIKKIVYVKTSFTAMYDIYYKRLHLNNLPVAKTLKYKGIISHNLQVFKITTSQEICLTISAVHSMIFNK